jgi:pimeloyl-ACP methyl ester carboxylesterase
MISISHDALTSFKGIAYGIDFPDYPLVLLHGFTENHHMWDGLMPHLSDMSVVIRPDLPGHGNSDFPAEITEMKHLAEWLRDFLAKLNISRCYLAGHSLGGYIALAVAQHFPEMLEGICLLHSTPTADSPEKQENRDKAIQFIRQNGGNGFVRTLIPSLFSDAFRQQHAEIVNDSLYRALSTPDDTLIRYLEIMKQRPSSEEWLLQSEVPVTAVLGTHDPLIACDITAALIDNAPVSHIHILHHSAHMGMLEEPAALGQSLGMFMLQRKFLFAE